MCAVVTIREGREHILEESLFQDVARICNRLLFGSALPVGSSNITVRLPFGMVEQRNKVVLKDLIQEEKHYIINLVEDTIITTKYLTSNSKINKKVKATQAEKDERLVLLNKFIEREVLGYTVKKYKSTFVIESGQGEYVDYGSIADVHVKNLMKLFMATYETSLECCVVLTKADMKEKYELGLQFLMECLHVPIVTTTEGALENDVLWYQS